MGGFSDTHHDGKPAGRAEDFARAGGKRSLSERARGRSAFLLLDRSAVGQHIDHSRGRAASAQRSGFGDGFFFLPFFFFPTARAGREMHYIANATEVEAQGRPPEPANRPPAGQRHRGALCGRRVLEGGVKWKERAHEWIKAGGPARKRAHATVLPKTPARIAYVFAGGV